MPVPSGPLSLGNIQTEYGGSNPISISEYYRGGAPSSTVPSVTSAGTYGTIPTSGEISMGVFRSKGKFIFTATIAANTSDYNISSAAISAGWDGSETLIATVTINAGIYVVASSTSVYALDTGSSFPGGHSISITNNGLILGRGGAGGTGGGTTSGGAQAAVAGGAGGPALRAQVAISVTNNGTIGGGGGGGGGGSSRHFVDAGGKGGGTTSYSASGGGGGGGRVNATLGSRGVASGTDFVYNNGANGTAGTLTTAGVGGIGSDGSSIVYAGSGGAGGALGTAGAAGGTSPFGSGTNGGAGGGGSGGAAVVGNSNITWVTTGTRLGSLL